MNTTEARDLFAYNRWANARLLDAAAVLSPDDLSRDLGSSFPSLRATLAHMLSAEWVWLMRLNGTSPTEMPAGWADADLDEITALWQTVGADQAAYLGALADDRLDERIDYRNLKGQPFSSSVAEILRHVVNHSTYHRGQLVTMLRQLGAAPPVTDLIAFYRTRTAVAE